MAYSNTNQASSVRVPSGAESIPHSATRDFHAGQPMSTVPEAPSTKAEERLERDGHLPGLSDVQNDKEKELRQPGQEDAAGNKIHHKSILKKMFHWEHNGMNAD